MGSTYTYTKHPFTKNTAHTTPLRYDNVRRRCVTLTFSQCCQCNSDLNYFYYSKYFNYFNYLKTYLSDVYQKPVFF